MDERMRHLTPTLTRRTLKTGQRIYYGGGEGLGGGARPWLSTLYVETVGGMADVCGSAVVLTDESSMCKVAPGRGAVNVSVRVDCKHAEEMGV